MSSLLIVYNPSYFLPLLILEEKSRQIAKI